MTTVVPFPTLNKRCANCGHWTPPRLRVPGWCERNDEPSDRDWTCEKWHPDDDPGIRGELDRAGKARGD